MMISTQAVIDSIGTTIDPKHELLTEVVGRYLEITNEYSEDFSECTSQKHGKNLLMIFIYLIIY